MRRWIPLLLALWAGLTLTFAAPSVLAKNRAAPDMFRGKVLTIIVPNAPGGPMDEYARLFAPYLAKALGLAQVRVDDVQGAGGVIGLNQLWQAPKDGFTIGFTNADVPLLTWMLEGPGVRYDGARFTWLGNVDAEPRLLVVGQKSYFQSEARLRHAKRTFVYPSAGFDDDFYIMSTISATLHFPLKIVTGYISQAQTLQAIHSGVADGVTAGITPVAPLIASGQLKPILAVANRPVPGYSQVPLWKNAVQGKDRAVAMALGNIVLMTRSFMGPPGMNPTAVAEIRAALARVMRNPALLATAKKAHFQLAFTPGQVQAEEVAASVRYRGLLQSIIERAVKSVH